MQSSNQFIPEPLAQGASFLRSYSVPRLGARVLGDGYGLNTQA